MNASRANSARHIAANFFAARGTSFWFGEAFFLEENLFPRIKNKLGTAIFTNDVELRDRLLQYRFHGSGGGYIYARVGYCSRLDALQAAILRVKLSHLTAWNETRRRNAARYRALLEGTCVTLPYVDPNAHHIYHQFTLRCPRRNALQSYLKEHGVASGVYYPLALHLQQAYASLGGKSGDFPAAERATEEVLSIPIHSELTDKQIAYVAELIRQFDS